MDFEGDAFISYAHLDNVELIEGRKGWVSNLHRALEVRVAQLLGKQPHIWRDPKLQGNDDFSDTLVAQLQRVAALVPVISPRYLKSEWTIKELNEFWRAAKDQGGVRFNEKIRIFKVLKTPVPQQALPRELQPMLGYEFFKVDHESGRVHELDEIFGPEAQRDFWLKLDDLAHDICCLLEILERPDTLSSSDFDAETIFLAESTGELKEQRETIRRDLQQHGYIVLPSRPLPSVIAEVRAMVQEDLARCRLSVHLIGQNYSSVPEGSTQSLLEIQNELAIERGKQGNFSRLLWIPPGLQMEDERQRAVVERVRTDPRILAGADLLETFLEDLRTAIHSRLKQVRQPATNESTAPRGDGRLVQIYAIYDQRDVDVCAPWVEFLFDQKFEVIRPVFEGDEAEIREYHEENLRSCDGVLIFYGSGNECWLRRKLRELQKIPGYGRTKPAPAVAIALMSPRTGEKERFRTHEATVIPQFGGFSTEVLGPFLAGLRP
jgi:hypothetical protein